MTKPARPPALRWLLLVAALALLAGSTSLVADFAYDDQSIVKSNPMVSDPAMTGKIFVTPYWGSRAGGGLYRPMAILSYALNHRLHKYRPLGYHLVNVLLHVAVSLLVMLTALQVLPVGAAVLAGALFAVHPIHTEAVANVVGRAEILSAAGFLAGWLLYQRAGAPSWGRRVLAGVALAVGVFSKEVALVLPVALLAWDLIRRRRPDRAGLLVQAAVIVLYLGLRHHVLGAFGNPKELTIYRLDNVIMSQPFLPGLWTAIGVFGRYAALLVWPWRLTADYSYPMIDAARPAEPWSWVGLMVLVGLTWLLVMAVRTIRAEEAGLAAPDAPVWARFSLLGLVLFGGTFFLVSNFVIRIGTVMAERLLYLPSAGACVLLAGAGWEIWRRRGPAGRRVLIGVASLLLAAAAGRSMARNLDWKDNPTLAMATLRSSPNSARSQFNMAPHLGEQQRWAEAIRYVRRAVELDPTYTEAWVNMGGYQIKLGHYDEARSALQRALALDPKSLTALVALGALEIEVGHHADAVRPLEQAAAIDSTRSAVHYDLALARSVAGDTAGAIQDYRIAARLAPGDADIHNNLAWLIAVSGGSLDEAMDHAQRALQIRPDGACWDTMAEILARQGRPDEARRAWEKALAAGAPNSEAIRMRLAALSRPHTD